MTNKIEIDLSKYETRIHKQQTQIYFPCPNCNIHLWKPLYRVKQNDRVLCRKCAAKISSKKKAAIMIQNTENKILEGKACSFIDKSGYKHIRVTRDYPYLSDVHKRNGNFYMLEHRLVMSEYLSRSLESSEIIHHKDRNKLNNNLDNLEILSNSEHNETHHRELKIYIQYLENILLENNIKFNKLGYYF